MIGKNNPFNIRTGGSRWLGSDGSTAGFVNFISVEYCVRAAFIIVFRSYRNKRIRVVSDVIHRWAPPSENNTDKYIKDLCYIVNDVIRFEPERVSPFTDVAKFPVSFLQAVSRLEGNSLSRKTIIRAFSMFGLKVSKK